MKRRVEELYLLLYLATESILIEFIKIDLVSKQVMRLTRIWNYNWDITTNEISIQSVGDSRYEITRC